MDRINETITEARDLLNSQDFGVLSTISVKLKGIPFGSVVPYCVDKEGQPVVLISQIAEHTHNIISNQKASITILMHDQVDIQSKARITISGNMEPVNDQETEDKYHRYFPNSIDYNTVHDFSFYKLKLLSIRYIGGFGNIHWIEANDFLLNNPFFGDDEIRIIEHMNKDHMKALNLYCENYKQIDVKKEDDLRMVGVDSYGFDLLHNLKKIRFTFNRTINTLVEAREVMVQMSKS